jgi:alkylhydroperoxidase family enzyme
MPARLQPVSAPYAANVQAAFDRMPKSWMPPFRLFTTIARHPELFERFIRGAPSYLPSTKLSIREREVLLHRVTARCGCEYEWGMRVHYFADEAGLTAAQVHATVHGDAESSCWEGNDALLIRLADELHDTCTIGDDLWPRLQAAFSDEAILELLLLAGYYRSVGYIANGLRLPLEPNVSRRFPAR